MEKFIVWDKENYFGEDNCFHELDKFLDEGLSVHFEKDNGLVIIEYDMGDYEYPKILEVETFSAIGKQDINGKEIYADCSIVEFEILHEHGIVCEFIATITYDKHYCSYLFKCTSGWNVLISDVIRDVKNLKVIDTIQENKLGLIK